jgi:ADP-ribosylglycohydrolase
MKSILLGMAIGDAVGVPYEFKPRDVMEEYPCTDMIGNGVHNQPIGTWSDDSSMAFCMLESLITGWDLKDMGNRYVNWFRNGYWTPHGHVFDMGFTTQQAILKLEAGKLPPNCCGGMDLHSNGNGSVMRILPIVPYFIKNKVVNSAHRYKMISDLSSLTHGHQLSVMSCFILTEFARNLYLHCNSNNKNHIKKVALMQMQNEIVSIKDVIHFDLDYLEKFDLVFNSDLDLIDDSNRFSGSGYCINTVTSAIWCILTTDNYRDAVLKAVNLGDDTDTTACVTGGLAGILYGVDGIPTDWLDKLVKRDEIINLADRYDEL